MHDDTASAPNLKSPALRAQAMLEDMDMIRLAHMTNES